MNTDIDRAEIIRAVAKLVGGEFRNDYSGRGMFGQTCCGIDCRDAKLAVKRAASCGLRGASVDSMGKGVIVYWPSVSATTQPGGV